MMTQYQKKITDVAEVFKALSHPARLCAVNKLTMGSLTVSQMQECLGISQPNVSQHLSILKNKGIIKGERIGTEVLYSLIDERMRALIDIFLED